MASRWIPATRSIAARTGFDRAAALAALTTTGRLAKRPMRSVFVISRSRAFTSPRRYFTALARSMRWGKSTFHSWGGT